MAIFNILTIVEGVILGVIALLLARVITPNEAYSSIAMQETKLDKEIGNFIGNFIALFPSELLPYVLLAAIYFITMVLTEIASNVATAIIMTPITLNLLLPQLVIKPT